MKKLVSLFLALILTLGMLAGISFAADMPLEVTEAQAGIVVTFSGSNDKYYFETLTQDLIKWAAKEMPGAPTFTLLKDLALSNPGESGATFLEIPATNADWYQAGIPANTGKLPMTFDLNGKTMSYEGASNLFRGSRWGLTLKNGTIIYNNSANKSRGIVTMGGTDSQVANSSATTVYAPEIVFDNVDAINISEGAASIVTSYLYATKLKISDSTLWSMTSAPLNIQMSSQAGIGSNKVYSGFAPVVEITNSVVGSSKHYFVSSANEPGATITVKDSILATGHSTGLLVKKNNPTTLDVSQDLTEIEGWTMEVAGNTLAAKATVIGKDPTKVELPFTDVKEGDWFFQFVSEMYGKKIIAGQTATTFNPNGNLTYGAALKLLTVGVNGKDVGNATSGHWATNYLNEAVAAGWTTIGADKLDAPVTREAFCEIAAKAKNLTEKAENPFKDTTNDAVLALVKAGVISGMSADTFNPTGVLTRAQIAKIISLLIKL